MSSEPDCTILIQGPPQHRSLSRILDYRALGPVVVSCWMDDVPVVGSDVALVATPKPEKQYYVGSANETFSYQVHSILNGLRLVKTPYVVRTRSDEYFNLVPFIKRYNRRDDKILCGNIFFKPWSTYHFHMGDHLFIARTEILLTAYEALAGNIDRYNNQQCAEQSSSFAILDAFDEPWTREAFARRFDVMDINELKPFMARWNGIGRDYDNHFNDQGVIVSMDQL
jgi:hypothetical protein